MPRGQRVKASLVGIASPEKPANFPIAEVYRSNYDKTIELIYDEKDNLFVTDAMYVFSQKNRSCPWAFMAVMQSALFLFLYRLANQGESRVIPQIKASKLDTIPFPALKPKDERAIKLEVLCKQMLAAKKQLPLAQSDADKDFYENKCASLDSQIDQLVYELYGLTDDEINLIEVPQRDC